jgi:N-acetylglucosaminyl-diphospho-decaprenol L-rhamnosyltransferase
MVQETGARATVAAVVVNHNAGDSLGAFLSSLRAEMVTDVIVVDNASTDGSSDGIAPDPAVRVIRTGVNLGYGSGANRGLAQTDADLVLISNPDVSVHSGALTALSAAFAADPTLAIAGPRILEADGTRYPSARRFPSMAVAAGHVLLGTLSPGNRFSRRYRMADLDPESGPASGPAVGSGATVSVDWVSGACFMARASALKELGGFDESYFMYVEDLDLCWRAHRAGWAVAYVPGATITHIQGMATARHPYRMLLAHHRSAFHFASKRAQGWRRLALPGVAVLLATRLAVAGARQAIGPRHKNERQGD